MPMAYAGNVDPVIWKLFSPSVTLDDVEKEFEDYSCFTFPALRALEGYLKYLLSEHTILELYLTRILTIKQLLFLNM